jgi:hypothetical protein
VPSPLGADVQADGTQSMPATVLPLVRVRLALALVSLAGVALELTMMRGLALRFWSHFACMVISVGLLGFGAAGSFLTLFQKTVLRRQQAWLAFLALGLAATIPVTWWLSQIVPLNIGYFAWGWKDFPGQYPNVLAIELLMTLPFLMIGAFVGVALMDRPARISGHYASDLLGSGCGGIAAVLTMNVLETVPLLVAITAIAAVAGALLLPWKKWWAVMAAAAMVGAIVGVAARMPWEPSIEPKKLLAVARLMEGTKVLYHTEGPLGRVDVLSGPAAHYTPGLSLQYWDDLPPNLVLVTDGDGVTPIYDVKAVKDWVFLDYRTAALAFHLRTKPKVCLIGAGGGAEIGLALYHQSPGITALEMNPQVIAAMEGPLAQRGGAIYKSPGVQVINQEARGFFAETGDTFDVIQLPSIDGFGASGSGLYASQESYIYTVESMQVMLDRLSPNGILSVTRWENPPPRQELRTFDMLAQALREDRQDPREHLIMIRSTLTTTALAFKQAVTASDMAVVRDFCKKRGFDLVYLPGAPLSERETNRFYQIDGNPYYVGAQALLGPDREKYLHASLFDLRAPTDDQPYFFHLFKWSTLGQLREKYGVGSNNFLELGYLMLAAGFVQTVVLALIFIVLPLMPGLRTLRRATGKGACLGYFLMIGMGFMLLEMGFVQKLVLYLAHPIYAAAVVISSFLVFAGLGSHCSKAWGPRHNRTVLAAMGVVVIFAGAYLLGIDRWLGVTAAWGVLGRCLVAAATIAPLAFAMGHMFPLGLHRAAQKNPALVPWSWAINGFASVAATAAAPLLAMEFGFAWLVVVAVVCYVAAACFFILIGAPGTQTVTHPPVA